MKTKAELEAMRFSPNVTIDVESVRNTLHALNEANEIIAAQTVHIAELEAALEVSLVAMAKQGANYDTYSPLRLAWQACQKVLFPAQVKS